MTIIKKYINTEYVLVFLIVLIGDVSINYSVAPSLLTTEGLVIKILGAFVIVSLYPQVKKMFLMTFDPEYTIFIVMGTAVAAAFVGNYLTDNINMLSNYPDMLVAEKNTLIATSIEIGFFLVGLLVLLIRSFFFMFKNKKKKQKS